jgi:hypothetical protein
MNMFYSRIVQKALKSTLELENKPGLPHARISRGQDSIVSKLIYDIFGGEILKTHMKKSWHFYNRINGKRVDLTGSGTQKSIDNNKFEDIPVTPAETSGYFDKADYFTFMMRFVRAFEEAVGLKQFSKSLTA